MTVEVFTYRKELTMFTMILISSVAIFVGIVGCVLIWGLDVMRADEIEHLQVARADLPPLSPGVAPAKAIDAP